MDQYATQMAPSSIPDPSQDELRLQPHPQPQPQTQRVEPVPFDMYTHSYQYVAPGPASTAYGMATTMFNAGMAQYGQPLPMQHMMGPTAVPPPFAPYFSQAQMAVEPSYDDSIPPFENYVPQPQMVPGPSYDTSPLPFGIHLPQPETAPGTSYGHPIPPPHSYDGYASGPQAMAEAPFYYPSPPSTVQSLDGQHLEHGPLQEARVGKRKAVDSYDAGRKTRTKRPRIYQGIPPDFKRIVKNGKVLYECPLPQCEKTRAMKRSSIRNHIRSNTHNERDGQFICTYCRKDLSREDSLKRHVKSCSKTNTFAYVPQGPDDTAPASFVPQPPMPQVPFKFQTGWAPSSGFGLT